MAVSMNPAPEGNLYPTTGQTINHEVLETIARNRDAIDLARKAEAATAITEANTAKTTATTALSTANTAKASADATATGQAKAITDASQAKTDASTALSKAVTAEATVGRYSDDVEGLKVNAGWQAGSPDDAQNAAFIRDPNSASRAELNAATARSTGVVTAKGMVADGVTDASAAFTQAAADIPDGMILRVPEGTYRFASTPSVSRKNIIIDWRGVTIRPDSGIPALMLNGSFGDTYPVTGYVPALTGETGLERPATDITVTGTPGCRRGDVLKIVADDPIPGGRPGDGTSESRIGEFVVVESCIGSKIRVLGQLREKYTTNVRIAKMDRYHMQVWGGVIDYPATNVPGAAILVRHPFRPVIDGTTVTQCPSAALQFIGCYGYVADKFTASGAVSAPETGNFGYGIMDNSSSFGLVRGAMFSNVRTGWTDDSMRISANSSVGNYGSTYGAMVVDSVTHSAHAAGFSCHGNSRGNRFVNCQAFSVDMGFLTRGLEHQFINCHVDGARIGIRLADEDYGTWGKGQKVDGFTAKNISSIPVQIDVRRGTNPLVGVRQTEMPFQLKNIDVEMSSTNTNAGIEIRNADTYLSNVTLTAPGVMMTDARAVTVINAKATVQDLTVDYNAKASSNTAHVFAVYNGAILEASTVRVTLPSTHASQTVAVNQLDGGNKVIVTDMVTDHQLVTLAGDTSTEPIVDFQELQGSRRSSDVMQQGGSAGLGSKVARTLRDVTANLSSTGTLTDLKPGTRMGQKLTIVSDANGTITINTGGSTLIRAASAISLGRYQSVMFVWNGTVWVHAG